MADGSHIEWTDATWNPVTGCSVKSPGCKHCYAMLLAGTRLANHPSRAGLTQDSKAGPVWTGEVRFNEQWLDQPLRWKRPRRIFVCAHGDLFHEDVPDEWIDRVFAVMALSPQHQFQVLTKRADRMQRYMAAVMAMDPDERDRRFGEPACDVTRSPCAIGCLEELDWPLPNVWLGVSVEDQTRADERIPDLLATPAAIRFLSIEPLLGPIDFAGCFVEHPNPAVHLNWLDELDWVIVGGESGKNARPMHPDWIRTLRDQCAATGTAFFFKQWGEWLPEGQFDATNFQWAPGEDGRVHWWIPEPAFGEPLPDSACSIRIGKKAAGRLLDRVEHNGMPA